MKKRLMSLLLSAAMIASMIVVPAAAADSLAMQVGAAAATNGAAVIMPGSEISVPVEITANPGVAGVTVEVTYPEELDLSGDPVKGDLFTNTLFNTKKDGVVRVVLADSSNVTATGVAATIKFTVSAAVKANELSLGIALLDNDADNCTDEMGDNVPAVFTNGTVAITYPVTATTGEGKQLTATTAEVAGSYTINAEGVTVDKSGVLYGASADALTNEAALADGKYTVSGAAEATVYYQAYATVGTVTYYGEVKSVVLAGPTATTVTVEGAAPVTVALEDQTVTLTAAVADQFGGAMADAAVEWSITEAQGVSIANGVVTVDKTALTGSVTVTATSGAASGTAVIDITRPDPELTTITAAASANSIDVPTAAVGTATVELSATGVDQFGVEVPVEVTWTVSEAAGVSVEGNVLTITNKAQAGEITLFASAGSVSDDLVLTINKAASIPASIAFEAETATLSIPVGDEANSKTFAVTGVDQFGDEMTVEATFALTGDDFVSAEGSTVTVKKGATAGTQYTLTATAGEATASIVITVVDIEMTWPTVALADATYGDTWADIVSLGKDGSAALDGVNVPGTFSVVDADVAPNAGEQTYTIRFVSDDGNYNVTTTGTAGIAKKAISAKWDGFSGLTYGDEVNVTATADVELTVSDNTNANAGTYTAKAAIAGDAAANYELTNAEQEYTVAQAEATITVPAQTIRAGKNGEQLAAQIGAIQAEGVNGEKIDGVLTVDADITGFAAGKTATVAVTFAHENANYVSPIAGKVEVSFTEGDPQTITVADVNATYGDAAVANAAVITEGGKGEITYASKNEKVAVVAADGTVTFVAAGTAVITVTAAADGDWAATTTSYTVTVAPKAVTISGVAAADKAYNGKTDADIIVDAAVIDGKVGEDDVTVNSAKAEAVFASANAGENIAVSFSGFALTGKDAANYVLSAQPADAEADITRAVPTVNVSKLRQTPNKVKDVVVTLTPASDDATIKVEYLVPVVDENGVAGDPAWTEVVPQDKGTYTVRVTVSGSANLEDVVDESNTLRVKKADPAPVVEPEEPEVPEISFTDVNENDWFYDYVIKAAEQGLFAGDDTGAFNPNAVMNRAMMVTVLAAIEFEGEGAPEAECDFTDLTADWYKNAVAWAASTGITAGMSDTEFAPLNALTREQVAVFLYAYAKSKGVDVSSGEDTNILSYNDAFNISEWAIPAMQWACAEGLINGTPEGDLMPVGTATRAQVAVILTNFVELLK